jgi:hypothetical protein
MQGGWRFSGLFAGLGLAGCSLVLLAQAPGQLPLDPLHDSGQGLTGAFEGWFKNPDGTFSLLLGYFNRNMKEDVDVPVGPSNHIDPGGPDQGQPTHFLTRRQWGLFTITVPKDFGDKKLTWTLVRNGRSEVIPVSLNPLWEISPFKEESMGNTPPSLAFNANGPFVQGPRPMSTSLTATVGTPLTLELWAADDAKVLEGAKKTPPGPPLTITWCKYRGPGDVKFAKEKPALEKVEFQAPAGTKVSGKATTTATFNEPGDYVLRVVANDWSGDGGRGFQCCWTNAMVKVSVKPAAAGSH